MDQAVEKGRPLRVRRHARVDVPAGQDVSLSIPARIYIVASRLQGRIDRFWRFLAIAFVVAIVILFYADWREFQKAARQVSEARQLEQQTDTLISSITDAETGERGYLLTGDPQYLKPYEKAVAELPGELNTLSRTAASVHRDEKQVASMRTLISQKMAELQRTIEVRDKEGESAALAMVRTDEGRLTMDEVRTAGKLLLSTEIMSLYQLENQSELHSNRSRIVVLAGCLGLVFLLFRLGAAVDTVVDQKEEFARRIEESRQLLETTLASIGDAVIVADSAGAVRFMNPVAEKLTGWQVKDAGHRPLSDIFHVVEEVSREPVKDPFRVVERKDSGEGLVDHIVLVARNGDEISIEDSSAPIRDDAGKSLGVVLVFRDVTARRIAERELERWKQIFSGAGFGMFVADSGSGVIVDMNPTFAAMHGFSVDELQGARLDALVPANSRGDFAAGLGIASKKGRHVFELQHLRRDGSEFPSLLDVTKFVDGRTEFLAGYCSDITERKRVEDALKESEERFRTLASALPQAIWSTDAQGNIDYVNDAWISYAGWKSGDEARKYLPHDPWKDLLHPEDRDEYRVRWNESLSTGSTFDGQVRLRRSGDGTYRWFLCRAVAVRDRAGRIVRWLGGFTDVQQQMEDATQLKIANQALQRSNADLEQFAYAASHDLQEPLRMVSIYSELLKDEYGSGLDGQAMSYIDFAVNGARRMSNLLTALLSYSRVANAAPQMSVKADSCAAVSAALLNLASMIEGTRASIEAGTLPTVRVPEIHLVQLFQNLIGNALKYRKEQYPDGERPEIRIDAKPYAGGFWLFSVSDNGIGIEPEYLTQIFGIFKRLHGSAYEGTGIGLALCQKIVERAGGHIWAESEPGKGSTFFFTLEGFVTRPEAEGWKS
jgi:PAS domain S-box-containing protein